MLGLMSVVGVRAQTTLTESFTNTTYDNGSAAWTAANAPGTTYVPTLTATAPGNGALSMTNANTWEASYIYSNQSFSAANASIYTTFQYSSFGGTTPGADGITFFLFDASQASSFQPGAYGGGLGYAPRDAPATAGLTGGYLGIGLDTYGNYSNPNEGKVGGPGFFPNAIAVRGPESGNYAYLAGTGTLPGGIDTANATTFNTVTISITPTNQLSVYMQYAGSGTTQLMLSVDLSAYTRPDNLMFGFTAGTGGQDDNHLIRDLTIATATASLWKNTSGDGTWANSANWNPNFVPANNSDLLLDNSTVSTAQTIDLGVGQSRIVRSVGIDAPFSYTLNNGTLEFQTGSFTGASGIFLTSTHGAATSQTVNSNLKLDNAIEIKNNTTSALNVTGNVNTNGFGLTLDGTGSGVTTLSTGVISGTGSVIKSDSGTAVLSGTNTYSGGTTLNAGTLVVGNNSALGTNGVTLNGGTLASNANNTITNTLALQGDAGLAVTGAGSTFTSQGALTQAGGSYTLNLGSGVTQQGAVNLTNSGTARTLTLQVDSGTAVISGGIVNGGGGAGSLAKTGAGTLQLNTASSYTGTTTVSNGTLQLGASNVLPATGNVSIDASGTLNLNTFSQKIGNLTALAGGATVDFGSPTGANTLVFGTYTAPGSGVLVVNNWQQGTDTLATTGAGQNVSTIYLSGYGAATEAGATSGTLYGNAYLLTPVVQTGIVWGGGTSNAWNTGTNWTGNAKPTNVQIAVFDSTGAGRTAVTLDGNNTIAGLRFDTTAPSYTISGGNTLTLSGTVPYVQQKSANNQALTFTTLTMGANTVFDFTGAGNLTVSSAITGAYNVVKDGSGTGTLILSGNNTYTGGLFINNGIVQMQSSNALGNGGTTTIATGAALEVANNVNANEPISVTGSGVSGAGAIHNVGGTNTLSGAVTMTGATTVATDTGTTLNLTGNITGSNYGLTLNGAGTLRIGTDGTTPTAGVIGLGTGGITLNSTGTTTFAGTAANTYTGTTTVNSGTLVLGKSAGVTSVNGNLIIGDGAGAAGSSIVQVATGAGAQINPNSAVLINSDGLLNLNGQSNTVAQLNASSNTAQVTLGAGVLTIGGNSNLNSAYAGTIAGTGSLAKAGSGDLTLSNANSYSGGTAINAGVITISNNTALGSGAATVTSGANLQLTNSIAVANALNLNGTGPASNGAVEATAGTNTLSGVITLQSAARLQADAGATLNLTNNVSLGAYNLNVGGNGNSTIVSPGVISGAGGSVTKDGSGSLVLSGTNTYTGATTINDGTISVSALANGGANSNLGASSNAAANLVLNGGTLQYTGAAVSTDRLFTLGTTAGSTIDASGSGALNLTNAGSIALSGTNTARTLTLTGANSGANTIAAILADNGTGATSLTKSGAGTWVLSGANTYSGATTISAGALQIGAGGTTGTLGTGAVTDNASLVINRSNAYTVASAVSGTGSLTQSGAGTTSLTGANTYSGTTTIGAGALQIGAGGTTGSLGTGAVVDNATLTINRSNAYTLSNNISGNGNLTQAGAGTTTLTGTDTRTAGTTTVTAGVLKLGTGGTLSASTSLTLNGGTFATNGFSDVVNGLYLNASSAIDYGGLAGILTVGTGTRTAGTLTINNWSGNLIGGGSDQLLVANATALNAAYLSNITFTGYAAGASIIQVGSLYEVVPGGGGVYTWNVDANGTWSTNANWNPNTGNPNAANANVIFGSAITANRTVTLDAARTAGYLNFNDNNNYTIAPAAAQRLTMSVTSGSAQINVANTGSPTISAGLTLNSDLVISQDNAAGTLTLSAANAITAGTANGNITVNGAGNTVISGTITTGTGALTKNEAGTLTLSGANTYTGATTINGGTLVANSLANGGTASSIGQSTNAAGNLVLNGGTLQYTGTAVNTDRLFTLGTTAGSTIDASGSGALNLTNAGSIVLSGANTARTLTLTGTNTGANTLAAILGDNGTGATALAKSGAGTWVLSGVNTYTGATTITGGTLQAPNSASLGSLAGGAVNISAGGTLDIGGNPTADNTNFGAKQFNISGAGVGGNGAIVNNAAVSQANAFQNVVLTGDATIGGSGRIDMRNGAARLDLAGYTLTKTGTNQVSVVGGTLTDGNVVVNQGEFDIQTSTNAVAGSGSLTFNAGTTFGLWNNSGTVTRNVILNGATIFNASGTSTVGSNITMGGNNVVNSPAGTVLNLTGNISETGGARNLTVNGGGTLTLTGTNTYSGTTTVSAGALNIGNGGTTGTLGTGAVVDNATLAINRSNAYTLANNISGNGNLTQAGAGTTTFTGTDTRTAGTTNVNAGVFQLGATSALSSSSSLTLAGGTFATNGFSDVVNGLYLNASSAIDYGGLAGILTVGTGTRTAGTLTINNWNGNLIGGGTDQLLVANATALNAAYLSNITFNGYAAGAQIIQVGSLFEVVPGAGGAYTWNVDANGNWSTNANWNPNTGNPNAVNANVIFGSAILANRTVTLDVARTAGYLNFNDNNNYTIAPAAAQRLTLSTTVGSAQINVASTGSPTISTGLTLASDLVISQDGTGGNTLTLSAGAATANAITTSVAGTARNITVNGAGNTTISGTITTAGGSLTKNEAGTLTLASTTNYSSYTGATTINGGVVSTSYLANGGANSNIGASTNAAANLVLNGGVLQYTGATVSTDRLFTVGTTAGSGIDASGSGALTFANTGSIVLSGTNTARTFTLTGTNTGANTLAAILGDNGSGATSLTKNGAGTWVLTAANTYSGTTTIGAGVLQVGAGGTIGTLGSGTITDNGSLVINRSNAYTVGGAISGTGSFTQSGTGATTLSGANSYSGGTTIGAGTVIATNNTALGSGTASVASGTTLGLQGGITLSSGNIGITGAGYAGSNGALDNRSGNNTVSSAFTLTGATDTTFGAAAGTQLTLNGAIGQSGSGNLYTAGTGTIVLGGNNSYTGVTVVNTNSVLVVAANNALGTVAGNTIIGPGSTLAFQGGINYSTAEPVTAASTGVGGNGAINNLSGNNTFAGAITLWDVAGSGGATISAASGTQLTLNGVVGGSDATAALKVGGAGTIVLGNSNTYTGTTTVNAGATLVAASNNALGTGGAATTVASGGTLGFQGGINYSTTQAVTVTGTGVAGSNGAIDNLSGNNAFAGTITLGAGGATIGAASGTTLTLSGAIGGTQPLTKAGTGTVSLTGAASYSGATAINAGTLKLGAGGSAMTGGSAVTIASGATFDVENGLTTNSIGTLTANAGSTLTIGSGTLITTGGTLAGSLAGTGTLKTSGNLAVTSNSAFSGTLQTTGGTLDLSGAGSGFSVSSLTLGAGTTLKLGSNPLAVGTLNITGASTIDFGNGVSATLSVGTFNLGANTISVTNWVNGADYFYAQNWTGATLNVRGSAPENQVSFAGSTPSYPASATAWLPYDAGDSDPTKRQITPAPEPATYGAIFMGLSLLGLGLRRWRSRRP
jgi:autotransporter-associated beta strand protein